MKYIIVLVLIVSMIYFIKRYLEDRDYKIIALFIVPIICISLISYMVSEKSYIEYYRLKEDIAYIAKQHGTFKDIGMYFKNVYNIDDAKVFKVMGKYYIKTDKFVIDIDTDKIVGGTNGS